MIKPLKIDDVFAKIDDNKKHMEFISTGFPSLDVFLEGGFLRRELVVVGAQTGVGKSIFAGHFFHGAAKQGFNCAYFSLEISNEMIVSRLLANDSDISPTKIMSGQLQPYEEEKVSNSKAKIGVYSSFMTFYDEVYLLEEILSEIKTKEYDFIVIDFIQNVMSFGDKEYDRLSRVALELQKIAKERNCCILILSQLSNFVGRMGQQEKFLEYKGSGNIATVCDLGFFVERDESVPNRNHITLRKNRRGTSGNKVIITYEYPSGVLHE